MKISIYESPDLSIFYFNTLLLWPVSSLVAFVVTKYCQVSSLSVELYKLAETGKLGFLVLVPGYCVFLYDVECG